MSAKYCKNKKCRANDGRPCPVADYCYLFKWDIDRQKGIVNGGYKDGKEGNKRKETDR